MCVSYFEPDQCHAEPTRFFLYTYQVGVFKPEVYTSSPCAQNTRYNASDM